MYFPNLWLSILAAAFVLTRSAVADGKTQANGFVARHSINFEESSLLLNKHREHIRDYFEEIAKQHQSIQSDFAGIEWMHASHEGKLGGRRLKKDKGSNVGKSKSRKSGKKSMTCEDYDEFREECLREIGRLFLESGEPIPEHMPEDLCGEEQCSCTIDCIVNDGDSDACFKGCACNHVTEENPNENYVLCGNVDCNNPPDFLNRFYTGIISILGVDDRYKGVVCGCLPCIIAIQEGDEQLESFSQCLDDCLCDSIAAENAEINFLYCGNVDCNTPPDFINEACAGLGSQLEVDYENTGDLYDDFCLGTVCGCFSSCGIYDDECFYNNCLCDSNYADQLYFCESEPSCIEDCSEFVTDMGQDPVQICGNACDCFDPCIENSGTDICISDCLCATTENSGPFPNDVVFNQLGCTCESLLANNLYSAAQNGCFEDCHLRCHVIIGDNYWVEDTEEICDEMCDCSSTCDINLGEVAFTNCATPCLCATDQAVVNGGGSGSLPSSIDCS